MINEAIKKLVCYGLEHGLVGEEDIIFTTNQLLETLQIDEYEEPEETYRNVDLESVLKELLDYAYEHGVLEENGVVYRDLFDTKLMAKLMPRPSDVIGRFWDIYHRDGPRAATDFYYHLSQDSDYIRRYRIAKDVLNKIKKLAECAVFNFHGNMPGIKHNTMLIVIHIGRILESPTAVLDRNRNNPVVLSGRMIDAAGISFIFHTQQTFGISALFCIFGRRNGFRIFLRFGKIDGNIHLTIRSLGFPFHIFCNSVAADIVAVLAEMIIEICRAPMRICLSWAALF